jgi:hypothetical protein
VDLCLVKFREDRRGRNAVETIAVIKYAKFHKGKSDAFRRSERLKPSLLRAKHFRLEVAISFVKQGYEYSSRR